MILCLNRFVVSPRRLTYLPQALAEGRDCSSPLPKDRFDVSAFYHPDLKKNGKIYCERGGFLEQDVLKFDRQFFKMPPGNYIDCNRIILSLV